MANPLYDALIAPRRRAQTPFLHLPDGSTVSHAAFADRAAMLAGALEKMGLAPGDRVAMQVGKSADALALYVACLSAGAVLLPLNTAYTPKEVAYFVQDSGARMLVCSPDDAEALRAVADKAGATLTTLDALVQAAKTAVPCLPVPREGGDLAAILYTSGTTGRSKGAMLSHDNLLSNARTLADLWRFTADDVLIHALPIFHTHGLFVATNIALLTGGAMVFLPRFDADAVVDAMPRATAMVGVPTFYTRLLDHPGLADAARTMRLFVSGSAPLLEETHRRFRAVTGHAILERYGMTETNMNTSNPYEGERRAGTVGLPLPGVDLRICRPGTDEVLPQGEIGVVEVRGPNVFLGYWGMPEKTAAELRADGWFITGDLGVVGPDGYVTIVGRDKDLIISGGLNIYPREVEQAIDAQPGVAESAVIGVPHPDLGEAPVAVIVAEPGAAPDLDAIAAAMGNGLARFKQPRRYLLADALPRNAMGKVQKAALRAQWKELFA